LLFTTGTIVYHELETWSWVDSIYFSVTTLTTIGYGDLYPTRDITKIFTVLYIFSGISTIFYVITHSNKYIMRLERKIENLSKKVLKS